MGSNKTLNKGVLLRKDSRRMDTTKPEIYNHQVKSLVVTEVLSSDGACLPGQTGLQAVSQEQTPSINTLGGKRLDAETDFAKRSSITDWC